MRRLAVPLLAALLVLGLVAPAAVAGHRDGKKPPRHVQELTLYASEDASTFITREGQVIVDEEFFAPNVGDRIVVTETVYDDADRTNDVGRNHLECTITEVVGELPEEEPAEGEEIPFFRVSFVCTGVLDMFGQGTLSWTGLAAFSSEDIDVEPGTQPFATVAITGGTEAFLGAAGQVAIFDELSEDEDEVLSRYEVTLLTSKRR